MIHVNKIVYPALGGIPSGEFLFLDFRGYPSHRGEALEVLQRPGVDGEGFRLMGMRGKPFTLLARNYVTNFAGADAAIISYKQLIKHEPCGLVVNSVAIGSFKVLAVEYASEPKAVMTVSGGFPGDNLKQVYTEIAWEMIG
jgi:hypothetical protein